jgi:hypothetical protein
MVGESGVQVQARSGTEDDILGKVGFVRNEAAAQVMSGKLLMQSICRHVLFIEAARGLVASYTAQPLAVLPVRQ